MPNPAYAQAYECLQASLDRGIPYDHAILLCEKHLPNVGRVGSPIPSDNSPISRVLKQNQALRITREAQTPRVTNNTNNAIVSRVNRGGSLVGSMTPKTGQNTRLSSLASFPEMQTLKSQGINSRISTNLFSSVPSNLKKTVSHQKI